MRETPGRPLTPSRTRWLVFDVATWILAVHAAVWLRYEFDFPANALAPTLAMAIGTALLHAAVGTLVGPYRIGHVRGSYEEIFDLGRACVISTALASLVGFTLHPDYFPRSATVTGGALALLGMLTARVVLRGWRTRRTWGRPEARPTIVFGAGEAGRRFVRGVLGDDRSALSIVALLDDDPTKRRLRIDGVPVLGTHDDLPAVVDRTGATFLVLAASHADPTVKRRLHEAAGDLGLEVKVLPSLTELLDADATERDLRDLDVTDLLGRSPVTLDAGFAAEAIAGRRVLVTGAGGSIGSELCRQLARYAPARLVLVDRDESGLQATQLSISGTGLLDDPDVVLLDIRDPRGLRTAFRDVRPEIVFHAAALKHLPLLERYPLEAWQTNVLGTLNVLSAARDVGVDTFVNISTDKAADPSCVLGYSKRITERLTSDFGRDHAGRFVSVRFGNVLGSRGSVVHAFTAQIARGGPVTVTDAEVTRYFMLIPEACQLVLEAAAIGRNGQVMVLDMGEPVRIVDVAHTLVEMSGRSDIDIVFTGLRPGEKLTEDLFGAAEARFATAHPRIDAVAATPLSLDDVRTANPRDDAAALTWMRDRGAGDMQITDAAGSTPRGAR